MSRKFNPYAYVDKALNDTMLGQAVGWDTATGWMNVVERRGRRPMAAGGANSAAAPTPPRVVQRQPSGLQPARPSRPPLPRTSEKQRGGLRGSLSGALADGITDIADAILRPPRRPFSKSRIQEN